jgi:hypothetical protein
MGFWVWVGLVGGKEMDRGGFAFPDGGMAKTRFFLLFIVLTSLYVATNGKKTCGPLEGAFVRTV